MKRSGTADLPLMGGRIPSWLYNRMVKLALPIVEAVILEYGKKAFLHKLSDPYWFQSLGAVIGMDWNSSGVTTAVTSALRQSINPHAKDLGLFVCGGKGKTSLKTPRELMRVGELTGLNGDLLTRFSKLSAKVDNTALQDGFQLYLHSFVVSSEGDWTVIQQGMQTEKSLARRYHWNSDKMDSFVKDPHVAVCGNHQGEIINLVHRKAAKTQDGILEIVKEEPTFILKEIPHMILPKYKGVKNVDVNIKRLGSILWLAQENEVNQFEDLLLLKGLGPRTLQSLTLVSDVIHGTKSRFSDPARFSFAHGSKGGSPIPVPTRVYDEVITTMKTAVQRAKIDQSDKLKAIKKLSELSRLAEQDFTPKTDLDGYIKDEKQNAWKYGGRTIHGFSKPPEE